MKAVILAGGMGTRISEETHARPKPMIDIGGKPILWHIMKVYSQHGINNFVICCGYKGYMIKEYFANYFLHMSDVTFDMQNNSIHVHRRHAEPWQVTLVDTGEKTATGGRLKHVAEYVQDDPLFCFTYGDGIGDIDITRLVAYHREQNTLATLTATLPPGRFGAVNLDGNRVTSFAEKPQGGDGLINGGFFVLSPSVIDFIESDNTPWEHAPLENLARMGQLSAYRHPGFWHPMDTLRDKLFLEELWQSGNAPWKCWS